MTPNDWTRVSDVQTASAAVITGQGQMHGLIMNLDGTNDATINIYDNTAASGKKLIPTDMVLTTNSSVRTASINFLGGPVHFANGIYVEVTCAGTVAYQVYWKE